MKPMDLLIFIGILLLWKYYNFYFVFYLLPSVFTVSNLRDFIKFFKRKFDLERGIIPHFLTQAG